MNKLEKNNFKNIFNDLIYDFNIFLESELLDIYLKKNPKQKKNILFNDKPEYIKVQGMKINVQKDLTKYSFSKNLTEKKNDFEIEPIWIKSPPLLEEYYKLKKIKFSKLDSDEIERNNKLNIYEKIENLNIITIRFNLFNQDNFNFIT